MKQNNKQIVFYSTKLDDSDFERTEREESVEDGIKALLELLAK